MAVAAAAPAWDAPRSPAQAMLDGQDLFDHRTMRRSRTVRWEELAVVFQKAMNALSPVHRIGTFRFRTFICVHRPNASRGLERARPVERMLALVESAANGSSMLYPHELSGGMMQRVSIAMSLLFNPKLLIMDEATTALDVVTQDQILDEIVRLEEQMGITRVMITHDISVVAGTCKNVAVLYAGSLLEAGPTDRVLVEPHAPVHTGTDRLLPEIRDRRTQAAREHRRQSPRSFRAACGLRLRAALQIRL